LLSACANGDLQALRDEPIASAAIPGGVQGELRESNSGTALGKPLRARLTRTFVAADDVGLDELLTNARDVAEQLGWEFEEASNGFYFSEKSVEAGTVELDIITQDDQLVILIKLI